MPINRIGDAQFYDPQMLKLRYKVKKWSRIEFIIKDDGTLVIGTKLCVPINKELKKEILDEAYSSTYDIHPNGTKMYQTLLKYHWLNVQFTNK